MPKILCLHGYGTSAAIFKSQTKAVRTRLDNSYVFDFIDAPFPATYAKGIDAFYKVATYSWWQKHTPQDIKESWQWIADYMRENGPYDAVCTFSQGGHVMSAMALYHAMQSSAAKSNADKPEPLPFRSAIFICGGIPLPILEDLSLQVPPRAYELCDLSSVLLHEITAKLQLMASNRELIKSGVSLWDGKENDERRIHDPNLRPCRCDVFGLDFRQFPETARIKIPTAHIYGAKDPKWHTALQLAEFCDNRIEYDHGGGHDIPRSSDVSSRIADIIKRVVPSADIV